jgi:hypothetical protein
MADIDDLEGDCYWFPALEKCQELEKEKEETGGETDNINGG